MLAHSVLSEAIGHLTPAMLVTKPASNSAEPVTVGMVAMVGDEFCRVSSVAGLLIGIERGCADTIPQSHVAGTHVWFFSSNIGSDRQTYTPGETVGVKLLPYTSSGEVPVAAAPAHPLTFNWRHARPYPPGNVKCQGEPWFSRQFQLDDEVSSLVFTWAHRDRILQLDQLLSHTASDVGPEPGVSYQLEVLDASQSVLRVVNDVATNSWEYTKANASIDFGAVGAFDGYVRLRSVRGGLDSLYSYEAAIRVISETVVVPSSAKYPMAFGSGVAMAVENFGDTHSKVFVSTDEGLNFTEFGDGSRLTTSVYEFSAVRQSDGAYVSVLGEKVVDKSVTEFRMVRGVIHAVLPTDSAKVFTRSYIEFNAIVQGEMVVCVGCNGSDFVVIATSNLIYSSTDGGATWTNAGSMSLPNGHPGFNTTFSGLQFGSNWSGSNLGYAGDRWFLSSAGELYFNTASIPTGTWTKATVPANTAGMMGRGVVSFAGALFTRATRYNEDPLAAAVSQVVLKSIDGGLNWSEVYATASWLNPYSQLFVIGTELIAIARDYGSKRLRSADGVSWTEDANTLLFVPSDYRAIRFGTKIATLALQGADVPYPMKITGNGIDYATATFTLLPEPSGLGNNLGNNLGGTIV